MLDELSIEELDKKINLKPLTNNKILKQLFIKNEYLLKRFLISILHLNIKPNECNIHYLDKEIPIEIYEKKKDTIEYNISINECIFICLETNKNTFQYLNNYLYLSKYDRKVETIIDLSKYTNIQIILNDTDKSNNLGEDIIVPYSIKTNTIYINSDIIYLKYLNYYYELYQNINIKKEESDYWQAMLMAKTFTELNNILKKFLPNNLRKRIIKEVYEISKEGLK